MLLRSETIGHAVSWSWEFTSFCTHCLAFTAHLMLSLASHCHGSMCPGPTYCADATLPQPTEEEVPSVMDEGAEDVGGGWQRMTSHGDRPYFYNTVRGSRVKMVKI